MLTLSKISKSYGGRILFEDVSLQVNRGDRLGLVGANGAGKTTLFSLILGEASPDDGAVILEKRSTLGFLPQESAPVGEETVLELATAISDEMKDIRKAFRDHESGAGDEDAYHDALARFDELGGYQLEPKAKRILKGLAFRDADFDRPARTLSGGWVMRAHLARLLVMEPDLLMLDEPTNHLDLESVGWFQNYLKEYPGALLMISHDREFLNNLVGGIVEIRQSQLHKYRGNYDDYVTERVAREEQQEAAYKNQQKEIKALQEFADRFRAKASKASQAQSKLKQIERMEKIEAPARRDARIHIKFPQPQRSGSRVITLKEIHQAYGEKVVYEGMNFEAERDQRIVLVGPNGAGKSTLLKILAGVVPFQKGERDLGHNVQVGYYAQYRTDMLDTKRTVLQEAMDLPSRLPEETVRTALGSFLFSGESVFKNVGVLSGGEKSRLALVKLLLNPPNLLLMDEPTTHLDMSSIEALITALKQYQGTLVFISHDVYFIRSLAKSVLHVNAGKLHLYPGDYQYYLDKSQATSERAGLVSGTKPQNPGDARPVESPKPSVRKTKEEKRAEAEARQELSRKRKEHQRLVSIAEADIFALEEQQKKLIAELELPETYQDSKRTMAIQWELHELTLKLEELTKKWEALAASDLNVS